MHMQSIKGENAVSKRWRIIIVGGGFGGLRAAQALKSASVEVTLIDRRNYHLFQPLLYQVATGSLSPGEIAAPLRSVLSRQKNTRVLLAQNERRCHQRQCSCSARLFRWLWEAMNHPKGLCQNLS